MSIPYLTNLIMLRKFQKSKIASVLFIAIVGVALGALALSSLLIVAEMKIGIISTTLLFLLPILWTSWIAFVILHDGKSNRKAYLLWLLIDLVALVLLNFLTISLADSKGPRGDDVAAAIAYSPLIWPMLFLIPRLPSELYVGLSTISSLVPKSWGILHDWIVLSLVTALPSLLIILFAQLANHFNQRTQR